MRAVATIGAVVLGAALTLAQGREGGGAGTVILEQAPKDRLDRHPQGEARPISEGHGCEEAPDASHDRGRQVQREHPAHHRGGDGAGAPDHGGPVGGARGRRHADDGRRAREGQDSRRAKPADQGGRRRLHPVGAAARRERREQQHHVAQRAVGHRLAGGRADGRRHPRGTGRRGRARRACRAAARRPPTRPAVAVQRYRPEASRRCPTATAAAASCSSRRRRSIRSWPACA